MATAVAVSLLVMTGTVKAGADADDALAGATAACGELTLTTCLLELLRPGSIARSCTRSRFAIDAPGAHLGDHRVDGAGAGVAGGRHPAAQ
jgi:hypothetical protein